MVTGALVFSHSTRSQNLGIWRAGKTYDILEVAGDETQDPTWAVSKRYCSSEGAKGMLARQLTRCLRARSFSLRAGIAYADAYAGLRTPGFCLREVRIATLLLEMKQGVLDVAHMDRKRPPLYLNTFASCCVRYEYHHWALAIQAHGYSMREIWVPWPPSPADCHA